MTNKSHDKAQNKAHDKAQDNAAEKARLHAYWIANLRLTGLLLAIWFAVSFGCGVIFREALDQFSIGGAPLGFWMAQQGAIYVFVVLVFVYAGLMRRLERRYKISQSAD